MSRRRGVSRLEEAVLAGALAVFGLSVAVLRLLADPASRLSRWVDREALPYGVTR